MMEYQELVKEIFKIIKDTDIEEIKISSGGFSFSMVREDKKIPLLKNVSSQPAISSSNTPYPPPEIENTVGSAGNTAKSQSAPQKKRRVAIKSPMVGRFFNSAGPDTPPYVMKGNHLEYGQKVGVVEAMKIYKDVVSSVKGVIVDVLVENNTPVEYGQELYLVETEE